MTSFFSILVIFHKCPLSPLVERGANMMTLVKPSTEKGVVMGTTYKFWGSRWEYPIGVFLFFFQMRC